MSHRPPRDICARETVQEKVDEGPNSPLNLGIVGENSLALKGLESSQGSSVCHERRFCVLECDV